MTGGNVIGIGSPRASLRKSNIATKRRVRGVKLSTVAVVDAQFECCKEVIKSLREPGLHSCDVRELEQSDCVLLVNERHY